MFAIVADRHRFDAGADSEPDTTSILRCRSRFMVLSITHVGTQDNFCTYMCSQGNFYGKPQAAGS